LIATTPWKGPAPVSAAGFTVTCNCPESGESDKLPDGGFTVSQLPPLLVIGEAVNVVTLELLLESVTACETGSRLLACKLKLSEVGFVEKGLGPVVALALRTTGIERNDPADERLIKPTSVPEAGAPAPTDTVSESGVFPLVGLTTNQL